jgi:hypothetical protein
MGVTLVLIDRTEEGFTNSRQLKTIAEEPGFLIFDRKDPPEISLTNSSLLIVEDDTHHFVGSRSDEEKSSYGKSFTYTLEKAAEIYPEEAESTASTCVNRYFHASIPIPSPKGRSLGPNVCSSVPILNVN